MDPADRPVPEPVRIAPPDGLLLILSNVPDQGVAATIARALVDERLAACVNVLGACRSVYRWKGEVEEADEVTLLVKTTRRRHAACQERLKALHPYEVPEIVTIAPDAVWPAYAHWAIAETRAAARGRGQD
ncbi:MAG: divalent-cation tolerance protein CutA [Burkholderiaceae bacterium]|nr:divalent-cation tolerance protein CutA [Burkholderiaceae bacterium]